VRVDVLLELPLLFEEFVHLVVAHRIRELHRDFVEAVELGALLLHRFVDVALHVLLGIEDGFLREKADARAFVRPRFALKFGVDARHDAEERRFAGAVGAEHANFCARIERQPDIVENDARRRNHLAQGLHYIDELRCHYTNSLLGWDFMNGES